MASAGKNPYDLTARKGGANGGPAATRKATVLTEAEQRERLQEYILIPNELWPTIRVGTHVRYIETAQKGGEFRPGGFVLKNPFDVVPKGSNEEKRFVRMQNNFYKGAAHKEWIVAYEDIEYLYAKTDAVSLAIQRDLELVTRRLTESMKRMTDGVRILEKKIEALDRKVSERRS